MRRGAATLAALAIALGCAGRAASPEAVVDRYLDALSADPIRTLALLSPEFHAAHGLRFEAVRDAPVIDRLVDPGSRAEWGRGAEGAGDADLERERAMLGWLTVLTKRLFARERPRLAATHLDTKLEGNAARVRVEVRHRDARPFRVDFSLSRAGAEAPWRIDALTIEDEARVPAVSAYLVAPTLERHRRLETALERRRRRERGPAPEPDRP